MARRCSIALTPALIAAGLCVVLPSRPTVQAIGQGCRDAAAPASDVLLCDDFEGGTFLDDWVIGSSRNTWPYTQFVLCGDGFGFEDGCAAWSNHLVFDGSWGFWGFDALRMFPPQSELYVRWYQYIADPYAWGPLEDKSVLLHDATHSITAYVATSRDQRPITASSGPGMPFIANYQDVDWRETGGAYTRVNRFQNQGNDITLQPGRWYLFEWYVKLNTPGASDGITKLWIDDATGPTAAQTLRLHYTDMRWLRAGDAGKEFGVLRLTVYHQRCDYEPNTCPPNGPAIRKQSHRWDRIVVSRSPIGSATPPGAVLSSPSRNAIVSGTVPVTADARADTVGVQFQLDGVPIGPEDTVPPYSASWDAAAAPDGPHTLTALVRNAAGAMTTSPRVAVTVANLTNVSRVEESDAGLIYAEPFPWIAGNTERPWSGATAALAFASGQRVTFGFAGTGVRWIGFRGPQTGVANVYLDGNLVSVVDAYSPSEELDAPLFAASGLAAGPHLLTIEVPTPRTRNRLSSDYFTVLDAFDVLGANAVIGDPFSGTPTRLEQTSSLVTYSGEWVLNNTARPWSGGTASLGFAAGQRATLHFVGTAVSWIGLRGPQTGIANVYLDGVLVAIVDSYTPGEEAGAVLFAASDLPDAPHFLAIEATGARNPASTDRFVVVDAFDVAWTAAGSGVP